MAGGVGGVLVFSHKVLTGGHGRVLSCDWLTERPARGADTAPSQMRMFRSKISSACMWMWLLQPRANSTNHFSKDKALLARERPWMSLGCNSTIMCIIYRKQMTNGGHNVCWLAWEDLYLFQTVQRGWGISCLEISAAKNHSSALWQKKAD